jgi:antitoxin ParD1/3/4
MSTKLSISVTDVHARLIEDAVASGQYASASEVVRDAMRRWSDDARLVKLWDEGIASGRAAKQLSIDDIKAEARRRVKRSAK